MILEIIKNNLLTGLQFITGIAGKNVNLPILNNILIQAKKGHIELISTNLELGATSLVRGRVEEVGNFTVPVKMFVDFINNLPEGNVKIVAKNNSLVVTGGKQKGIIRGSSADDFPLIPKIEEVKASEVSLEKMLAGLQAVVAMISTNETRPEISGCLFRFNGQELTLVGTDSFRLSEKIIKLTKNVHTGQSVIVPLKTMQELIKIIALALKNNPVEDKISIFLTDNQILFKLSQIELISRLIDGSYPDYKQIIPASTTQEVEVSTSDLIRAVRGVSIFSELGVFDVHLTSKKNTLILSAQTNQSGEGEAIILAQIKGGDFSIVLNSRYLLDALNTIATEEVVIGVNTENSPCVLKPGSKAVNNTDHTQVIMPIKQ